MKVSCAGSCAGYIYINESNSFSFGARSTPPCTTYVSSDAFSAPFCTPYLPFVPFQTLLVPLKIYSMPLTCHSMPFPCNLNTFLHSFYAAWAPILLHASSSAPLLHLYCIFSVPLPHPFHVPCASIWHSFTLIPNLFNASLVPLSHPLHTLSCQFYVLSPPLMLSSVLLMNPSKYIPCPFCDPFITFHAYSSLMSIFDVHSVPLLSILIG